MEPNLISDRDVAKAKELLRKSAQDTKSANSISNKDIKKAKRILAMFDKTLSPATLGSNKEANSISDKDVKMLEKSFLKDESKSLRGKAFANGGKVDFKGSF